MKQGTNTPVSATCHQDADCCDTVTGWGTGCPKQIWGIIAFFSLWAITEFVCKASSPLIQRQHWNIHHWVSGVLMYFVYSAFNSIHTRIRPTSLHASGTREKETTFDGFSGDRSLQVPWLSNVKTLASSLTWSDQTLSKLSRSLSKQASNVGLVLQFYL
ncbi:hypothetical protein CKAH01_09764 [Colletotrichum kahawae]|uniref:Uncharacterized protein n=1 Tax=Colletotrichum kahawae TaxID=34407 RepID=A0AAE0CYC4_COLKA|nr:hypothetical protein CKAH01_09764 [Colletotrichum kahawae]